MNIKDSYIHNGEAILKDILVSGSKLQKLKAGKDANDAYLTWVDVLDLSPFGASGHNHDDRYLKLTGGTITNTNVEVPLSIIGKGSYSAIKFLNSLNPAKYRVFGINSSGDLFVTNQSGWNNEHIVYHSGNLSIKTLMGSTAIGDTDEPVYWNGNTFVKASAYPTKASWNYDDVYLKLSGGNLTGRLSIQTQNSKKSSPISQQLVINGPDYDANAILTLQTYPGIGFHMPGRTWASLIWNGNFTGVNSDYTGYVGFYGSGFKKDGSNDNYVLLGGGGHKLESNLSVSSATYASNIGSSGIAGTNYVTAAKVISACNWYDTMIGSDSDKVINRWSEIVDFVAGFEETSNLATFLSNNYLAKSGGIMSGNIILSNSCIIQNLSNTSNYTTPITWYKGGVSQNTYNPLIGQHNTGGDGTGSICILPYATSTDPWSGNIGLFIQKNNVKIDGVSLIKEGDNRLTNSRPANGGNANTVGGFDPLTFYRPWNQSRIYIWKRPVTTKLLKVATIQGYPSTYSGLLVKGKFHYRETNDLHTYSTKEIPFQILFDLCYSKDSNPKIWTTAYGKSYNCLKVVKIASSKYEIQVPANINLWCFVWIEYQYYKQNDSNTLIPEADDASGTENVLATWEIKDANILPEDYSNYANSAGSAGNAIYITPQSYTPTSDTVGGHKDGLVNWLNTDSATGIGKNIIISESIISQWDNDSAKPYPSSVYAMIKIGGGYNYSTYGQWLLSSYNQTRLGVVGRNSDVWSSIKWIAWTSDIPTKISQLTNDSGYVTSSGVTSVATGTGLTGGTITSTGTISINSTYQTYISHGESAYNSLGNYVLKKPNVRFYNYIGCNVLSNWYKITLPFHNTTSTNNRWMMVSMELILKGNYSNGADGTIYLSYYIYYPANNNIGSADKVYALAIGSNMNDVRIAYNKTDLGILYVYVPNNYNSFAIQNLSANDTAPSYDFTTTTIDALSSSNYPANSTILDINIRKLYTTNGTSLMLNGNTLIDAGNIGSQSVSYADSAGSVARATFGDGSNGTHDANAMTSNGLYYYTSNGPTMNAHNFATNDAAMYVQAYSTSWVSQIAQDYRSGKLAVRGKNNGTWQPWRRIAFADSDYIISADRMYYEPEHRKFTRTASGSNWDTQAYSVCGYKECRVTYKISQTNAYIMVGLNSDPTTDASYSSIDYCWYTQDGGNLCIYENSSYVSSISGHTTYAAGDELIVEYSCGQVRYYHNGVLCRTVARTYGSPLYFDCSFHQAGSIENVVFEPIHDGLDFVLTTATYSLSNAAWTNTISLPSTTGSYILNITSGNSTLTGVFSIGTSDNAKDEISLHLHGNGPRLYARTNGGTLLLSSNNNNATSYSVTIKYRRMI